MKIKIISAIIIGLIALSPVAYTQQVNYPTKIIDGIEYYIYTVQTAEGLYTISKKFGVSQAEINNANPQIHDGLKADQEILIPKKGSTPQNISPAPVSSDVEYVLHTAERRQTLFAISRKYNVTQEVIMQANPQIRDRGLQVGDVLRIPVNKTTVSASVQKETPVYKVENKPQQPVRTLHVGSDNTYITHVVESKETLYSISRKYNVTSDEIKALNPGTVDVLKTGITLKIPFKSGAVSDIAATPATPPAINQPKQVVVDKNTYKIAYLLPFMLGNSQTDPTVHKFIEFYMGSLLAINNAKNGNVNFEIFTFDIEKSETKVFEVINKPEMQEMDLIIGPAYTGQIPVLTDFAKRRKINTLIPFSSKVANMDSNPYIFQFNPDQDLQNDYLVNVLKTKFSGCNLLFVETGNAKWSDEGMDFFNYLMKKLDRQKIPYNKIKGADLDNPNVVLSSIKKDIIVFDTEDIKSVQAYLNKLYDLSSKYDLGVIGQYAWRDVSGKKPKMYYVSPFAGEKGATQFYEMEYQKYYGKMRSGVNPRFDLLGYDLTTYFLSTMKKSGFTFNHTTQSLTFNNGVQSDFNFVKTGKNGGYVNQQLYLIEDEAKRN